MSPAPEEISLRELAEDALGELMNIGSGHALSALSKLVGGRRLLAGLPELSRITGEEAAAALGHRLGLAGPGAKLSLAVMSPERARLTYRFAVLLGRSNAEQLSTLLTTEAGGEAPGGEPPAPGVLALSALGELGNILGSAFLTAVSELLGPTLMPSPPAVTEGELGALLSRELRGHTARKPLIALSATFASDDGTLGGLFLVCLEQPSAVAILELMGIRVTTV